MDPHTAVLIFRPHVSTDSAVAVAREILHRHDVAVVSAGRYTAEELQRYGIAERHFTRLSRHDITAASIAAAATADGTAEYDTRYGEGSWAAAARDNALHGPDSAAALARGHVGDVRVLCAHPDTAVAVAPGLRAAQHALGFVAADGTVDADFAASTAAGAEVAWLVVSWPAELMSYPRLLSDVVGGPNPLRSPVATVRGALAQRWETLGVRGAAAVSEPSPTDPLLTVSSGPLHALADRLTWTRTKLAADETAARVLGQGVPKGALRECLLNPMVPDPDGGAPVALFDLTQRWAMPDITALIVRLFQERVVTDHSPRKHSSPHPAGGGRSKPGQLRDVGHDGTTQPSGGSPGNASPTANSNSGGSPSDGRTAPGFRSSLFAPDSPGSVPTARVVVRVGAGRYLPDDSPLRCAVSAGDATAMTAVRGPTAHPVWNETLDLGCVAVSAPLYCRALRCGGDGEAVGECEVDLAALPREEWVGHRQHLPGHTAHTKLEWAVFLAVGPHSDIPDYDSGRLTPVPEEEFSSSHGRPVCRRVSVERHAQCHRSPTQDDGGRDTPPPGPGFLTAPSHDRRPSMSRTPTGLCELTEATTRRRLLTEEHGAWLDLDQAAATGARHAEAHIQRRKSTLLLSPAEQLSELEVGEFAQRDEVRRDEAALWAVLKSQVVESRHKAKSNTRRRRRTNGEIVDSFSPISTMSDSFSPTAASERPALPSFFFTACLVEEEDARTLLAHQETDAWEALMLEVATEPPPPRPPSGLDALLDAAGGATLTPEPEGPTAPGEEEGSAVRTYQRHATQHAVVLLKPPSTASPRLESYVAEALLAHGITVADRGVIHGGPAAAALADRHHGAIARFAAALPTPEQTSQTVRRRFREAFGQEWAVALRGGVLLCGGDAVRIGGVTRDELLRQWVAAGPSVKLEEGLLVARLEGGVYVVNGFYPALRQRFAEEGTTATWLAVEWPAAALSWERMRSAVVGCTDPAVAPPGSIRGYLHRQWRAVDLPSQPTALDNAIRVSAGPLQAVVERQVWCGGSLDTDPFMAKALAGGASKSVLAALLENPTVVLGARSGACFDVLRDMDAGQVASLVAPLRTVPVPQEGRQWTDAARWGRSSSPPRLHNGSAARILTAPTAPLPPVPATMRAAVRAGPRAQPPTGASPPERRPPPPPGAAFYPKAALSPRPPRKGPPARDGALQDPEGFSEAQLRACFNALDRDGRGFIRRETFKADFLALEGFGKAPTEAEMDRLFAKYDRRQDGLLDFDEFALFMLQRAQQ